jgi:hypothetical protein
MVPLTVLVLLNCIDAHLHSFVVTVYGIYAIFDRL